MSALPVELFLWEFREGILLVCLPIVLALLTLRWCGLTGHLELRLEPLDEDGCSQWQPKESEAILLVVDARLLGRSYMVVMSGPLDCLHNEPSGIAPPCIAYQVMASCCSTFDGSSGD